MNREIGKIRNLRRGRNGGGHFGGRGTLKFTSRPIGMRGELQVGDHLRRVNSLRCVDRLQLDEDATLDDEVHAVGAVDFDATIDALAAAPGA